MGKGVDKTLDLTNIGTKVMVDDKEENRELDEAIKEKRNHIV